MQKMFGKIGFVDCTHSNNRAVFPWVYWAVGADICLAAIFTA